MFRTSDEASPLDPTTSAPVYASVETTSDPALHTVSLSNLGKCSSGIFSGLTFTAFMCGFFAREK